MKDSEDKLDLLMECYLGKHHPIHGARVQVNSWGLGNTLNGILGNASNYLGHINREVSVFRAGRLYQRVQSAYDSMPFDKLDPYDQDFKILFEVRVEVTKLGEALEFLIEKSDSEAYNRVDRAISNIMKLARPHYENAIIALWNKINPKPT